MIKKLNLGNFLAVQELGLHALTIKGLGSISDDGTKIIWDTGCGQQ